MFLIRKVYYASCGDKYILEVRKSGLYDKIPNNNSVFYMKAPYNARSINKDPYQISNIYGSYLVEIKSTKNGKFFPCKELEEKLMSNVTSIVVPTSPSSNNLVYDMKISKLEDGYFIDFYNTNSDVIKTFGGNQISLFPEGLSQEGNINKVQPIDFGVPYFRLDFPDPKINLMNKDIYMLDLRFYYDYAWQDTSKIEPTFKVVLAMKEKGKSGETYRDLYYQDPDENYTKNYEPDYFIFLRKDVDKFDFAINAKIIPDFSKYEYVLVQAFFLKPYYQRMIATLDGEMFNWSSTNYPNFESSPFFLTNPGGTVATITDKTGGQRLLFEYTKNEVMNPGQAIADVFDIVVPNTNYYENLHPEDFSIVSTPEGTTARIEKIADDRARLYVNSTYQQDETKTIVFSNGFYNSFKLDWVLKRKIPEVKGLTIDSYSGNASTLVQANPDQQINRFRVRWIDDNYGPGTTNRIVIGYNSNYFTVVNSNTNNTISSGSDIKGIDIRVPIINTDRFPNTNEATIKFTGYDSNNKSWTLEMKVQRYHAINPYKCVGCGACESNCPVFAIVRESNGKYKVISEECINCGECKNVCDSRGYFAVVY